MRPINERTKWVSYERVSTAEQADRELSLLAQHQAIVEFATRHGAIIERDYVEAGASGTDPQRPVLQRLLGKTVARTLNQRGYRTRSGALWSKNRIMWFLEHEVVAGTIWWGQRKGKGTRPAGRPCRRHASRSKGSRRGIGCCR